MILKGMSLKREGLSSAPLHAHGGLGGCPRAYCTLGGIGLPKAQTTLRSPLDVETTSWFCHERWHLFVYLSAPGGSFFTDPAYSARM
jgi:hypothetical protein